MEDTIKALMNRIEQLEVDKAELQEENKALLDSLNSQDTAEEMTIEEMLNREG